MDISVLPKAVWTQKKKTAELLLKEKLILSMEFGSKKTRVFFEDRKLEIRTDGFWKPHVTIQENDKVLLLQKHIGFWGNRNEVVIGNNLYEGKTKTGMLYNVQYTNYQGIEVVSYRLNTLKWKASMDAVINPAAAPAQDVLLLFILGYYTVRSVIQESDAASAIILAGA